MLFLGRCHSFFFVVFPLSVSWQFSIPVTLFPVMFCSHLSCPFPLSHFFHLCFPRQRSRGPQNALSSCEQLLSQTPTHRCQLGDWLSFFPSFSFHSFFLPLHSLLFPSLSCADLLDQPSKTDSRFFTDHDCVSSYATKMERERKSDCVNMWHLSVFVCSAALYQENITTQIGLAVKIFNWITWNVQLSYISTNRPSI